MKRIDSPLVKAKKKAQKIFNEWVRLRDCYNTTNSPWSAICFTCGRDTDNLNGHLHASHFLLDSKNGNSTSFDPVNVNSCCKYCNRMLHGNLGNYAVNIIKVYGQTEMDRLQSLKLISKKWTISELEDIEKLYKEKIKTLC